ncbi:MAG: protoheme IX farnesyltransferase [Alphaproteobacteria bacterium]|nr:protoheme IX farnesyltransferase [Alphaproteobacteria bacterium]
MLRTLGSVFKLRIGVFVAISAVAGALAQPGSAPSPGVIAAVAFATLLSAASAGAFNHYYERVTDRNMARTANRPFATGAFTAGPAWLAVMAALLVGSVLLAAWSANLLAAAFVFLGAFVYGCVYTVWLKRRTVWNIVIGGLSGSFAVLAGAAIEPGLSAEALILAVVLFLWTPPHFWSLAAALRDDYKAAGVPMLPVVMDDRRTGQIILANTVALVAVSLLPPLFGAGMLYLAAASIGGAWFIARSVAFARAPSRATAMSNFFASLVQLSLLLAAVLLEAMLA